MSVLLTNIRIISPGSPLHQKTEVGIVDGRFVDPTAGPFADQID